MLQRFPCLEAPTCGNPDQFDTSARPLLLQIRQQAIDQLSPQIRLEQAPQSRGPQWFRRR